MLVPRMPSSQFQHIRSYQHRTYLPSFRLHLRSMQQRSTSTISTIVFAFRNGCNLSLDFRLFLLVSLEWVMDTSTLAAQPFPWAGLTPSSWLRRATNTSSTLTRLQPIDRLTPVFRLQTRPNPSPSLHRRPHFSGA